MNRSISSPQPPGWRQMSVSEWVSDWHQKDAAVKIAQTSNLVDTASITYDSAFYQLKLLSECDSQVFERWLLIAGRRRQREFESIMTQRKERADQEARSRETGQPIPPKLACQMTGQGDGIVYGDIPLTCPSDLTFRTEKPKFLGPPPSYYRAFELACREGSLATVQSALPSENYTPTPAFLHHGLCLVLKAGNVEAARYFLESGAPIIRRTPEHILKAPVDQQIPLFELFVDHGWTPNTPGEWGAVLLPQIMQNHSLLQWFLAHGANPNVGEQQQYRFGESITNSCAALETSAYGGDVEAVRMLLDAGALIENGFPLHAAAEARQYERNSSGTTLTNTSKEFDSSRIPVMALLVERGADVNQFRGPQMGNMVLGYPILCTVIAGAVERARWLLEHGADPTKEDTIDLALKPEESYYDDELPVSAGQNTQRRQAFPRLVGLLGIISCLWLTLHWLPVSWPKLRLSSCHHHARPGNKGVSFHDDAASTKLVADSERVPFEAHIMSKCPDARDCIRELVVPTMERVSDKVDFDLSFIASVSNQSSDVDCMHGPGECIGDMLMLCAANLPFPPDQESDRKGQTPTVRYLGFATCLISSYEEIPDRTLVEQCALEHGIEFDALNECVSQQDDNPNKKQGDRPLSGIALLRESARHSAELGVRTSCTVRLDDAVWCVRDGGVWKDCAENTERSQVSVLVDEIEKLWGQRN
ncbi:hypothetical protein BDV06DRAFT_208810 [Aspergillus oleicola]